MRLPPSQSYIETTVAGSDGRVCRVIASALQPLVLTQDPAAPPGSVTVADDQDLEVSADEVVVRGPLSLPSCSVSIVARTLDGEPSSAGAAAIDVSGIGGAPIVPSQSAGVPDTPAQAKGEREEGAAGGTGYGGDRGNPGISAGKVSIYSWQLGAKSAAPLTIDANGGDGSAGQQGGNGGVGGRGANGREHAYPTPCGCVVVTCTDGGTGGRGGEGGEGGNGGNGGACGSVTIGTVEEVPRAIKPVVNQRNGNGGAGGGGGNGGAGGRGGEGAYTCDGGSGGPWGEAGPPGQPGATGTGQPGPGLVEVDGPTYSQHLFAPQLQMMMALAKTEYLFADPIDNREGYGAACALFEWLAEATAPFGVQPPPRSPLPPSQVSQLSGIHQQCLTFLGRLATKVDFYGHRTGYAPMLSYSTYEQLLEELLGSTSDGGVLGVVEDAYTAYFAAEQNQSVQEAQLNVAVSQAQGMVGSLTTTSQALATTLDGLVGQIAAAKGAADRQREATVDAVEAFATKIATAFNCASLTSLISGLGMCAFVPAGEGGANSLAIAIGAAVGGGVANGLSTAPVTGMQKEYVINQVQALGGDISTLQEGFTVSGNWITEEDPNGYKMLADAKALEQQLQIYRSVEGAEAAEAAVQKYVQLVQNLNALIMEYNNDLTEYLNMEGQIAQLQAQIAQAEEASSNLDPTLPSCASFMGALYEAAKNLTLNTLYLATKSFRMWALEDLSLTSLLSASEPSQINHATLTSARGQLLGLYSEAQESFGRELQPFPADGQRGIVFVVDDPASLAQFAAHGSLDVTIPLAEPNTTIAQNPFAGLTDIRVTKARPWIDGATVSNDSLMVTITHTGGETIVTRTGTPFFFQHDQVVTGFRYRPSNAAIQMDADITVAAAEQTQFGLLGPFTTWRVEAKTENNAGLDLSGVTKLEIEFAGYALAASAEGKTKEPRRRDADKRDKQDR